MLLITAFIVVMPLNAFAASEGSVNMSKVKGFIDQSLDKAKTDLVSSKQTYDQFHDHWLDIEDSVKADSKLAYRDVETQMGQIEYAFMLNKQQDAITALQSLQQVAEKVIQGQYEKGTDVKGKDATLSDYVMLLQQTKENVQMQDQANSLESISKVRETWLSVEGIVVAQSASIYSNTERDMVVVNAMITDKKYDSASKLLDTMIAYLTPLAQKSSYTYWDAAMIPIREGLEALLVVGALLAFVKKSKNGKGASWIWSGVAAGFVLSAILAIIIKFVFSSGAFGKNNFLISGWTGVFAAAMLLYMSYWLHSNSNIQQWNQYIQSKTQNALSTGRVISLGVLSFLAVFREGTETVLFVIGMVNQISTQQLLLGILIGFGILAAVAYLMLFVGVKLPIRPFFLISSLIVFYLCEKFMGLGVHGLQLAGFIPVSNSSILPSIDFLGFFPSWQSAVPQLVIAVMAVAFLIGSRIRKRKTKSSIVLS
jgi:high-affinity iron transporter